MAAQVSSEQEQARRAAWIAVLPFENLSGDPDQDYFADGITEDLITGLAAWRSLRVIARTSTFRYKDTTVDIGRIAEELGVRFVLEGSVRKAGNRVRVTAQLIEAPGGHHVWADRYDGELEDIFEVQDRITRSIVVAIDPAIRLAEAERVARIRPDSLDAWGHMQRGMAEYDRFGAETNREARRHFEAAIALDADYAQAYAALAWTHAMDAWLRWVDDLQASLELAYEAAKRAIELDPRDAFSFGAMAMANYAMGRTEATVRAAERAVHLNPSLATAHLIGGAGKAHGGDPEGGIRMYSQAIALSPRDPTVNWSYGGRALAQFMAGNNEEAVADARTAVELRYGYLMGRVTLTAALAELGRLEEARTELETILTLEPDFSPAFLELYTFGNPVDRDRLVAGLQAAGLDA